jgi:hypothetical protein
MRAVLRISCRHKKAVAGGLGVYGDGLLHRLVSTRMDGTDGRPNQLTDCERHRLFDGDGVAAVATR